jgi:hypothetical protein
MAMGRMWAEYFDGGNGGGGGGGVRHWAGWAGTVALQLVPGGGLRWPLEAVAGVVN